MNIFIRLFDISDVLSTLRVRQHQGEAEIYDVRESDKGGGWEERGGTERGR